ncbi:MAG: Rieske 2Fe-2S domain-containing protein [Bacteroidota bacterium]
MKKYFNIFLILIASVFLVVACKKENKNTIPYVYVSFYLNISSTLYFELSSVGGWVNLTGGYHGVVVYRESADQFVAFDRACPYDWDADSSYVSVEPSGLVLKCKACGSEYIITDGSIVKGPATYPLKQYNTVFDGQTLHVYN